MEIKVIKIKEIAQGEACFYNRKSNEWIFFSFLVKRISFGFTKSWYKKNMLMANRKCERNSLEEG